MIQICRRVSYESGNKCGKLLASSLREQVLANYIPHIRTSSGQKHTLPHDIVGEFREFYASLYNLQTPALSQSRIEDYLTNSGIPRLYAEVGELLEEPIAIAEIQSAIGTAKLGKAPGPDGLTAQYFKTLLPSLEKFMCNFSIH